MATLLDRISLHWETRYPVLSALVCALLGYFYAPDALHYVHQKQWAIENIFVAVFTLSTVIAGFGFAVYTFLLTTESGFIGRVKNSIYYRHLLTYVLWATALSAALAVMSIPGTVVKDAPDHGSIHAIYVGLWLGVCAWTFSAFFRAARLFSVFAREHH
jgi:hypothetical protein